VIVAARDQRHEALRLGHVLEDEIARLGRAALDHGQVLARQDHVRAAGQGGEEAVERLRVGDFPAVHTGEELIELRGLPVRQLHVDDPIFDPAASVHLHVPDVRRLHTFSPARRRQAAERLSKTRVFLHARPHPSWAIGLWALENRGEAPDRIGLS